QPEVHKKKYISTLETPKNVRLQYITDATNDNQHHSKISSPPSPSLSSHPQQYMTTAQEHTTTINKLHQIPTMSKWSTRKKVLVGISASLIIATIITVPIVLGILLTKSKESTSTTATTASTVNVSAYWSFDNTAADSYGVYNGQLINSPSYASSSSVPYVGHGQALYFNSASSQSVLVSTPFFNLSYTSFTIEAWIYYSTSTSDHGIFGQCQCSTCANQYAIKSNAQPYQGQNGSINIGSAQAYSTTYYYLSYIDNVALTTRAKSSVEILRDASLMAYYSFDLPNPTVDNGPNGLDGTSNNIVTASGRVNEAMRFLGSSSSYFRAYGFYQISCGVVGLKPFSMAMWINPSSISNIAIIQMFYSTISSGSCDNLLGISSTNLLTGQLIVYSVSSLRLTGPFVTQNTWTHISLTYSSGNGYTLYVNGVLFGSTGIVSYWTSGTFANLCISYSTSCSTSSVNGYYQGYIDELYIYNRELSQTDITSLANP
ncbi:unnamed protein product, partial [Rotaria sordida]